MAIETFRREVNKTNKEDTEKRVIKDFKFYPNPFSNYLNIENTDIESATLTIFDLVGRIVFEGMVPSESYQSIDTEKWMSGTYYYNIKTNNSTKNGKLIKL